MVIPSDFAAYGRVQIAPPHSPALPYRVDKSVQFLSCVLQFGCWDAAERPGAALRLVVAANEVSARITAPERQAMQVGTMRVNLSAIG